MDKKHIAKYIFVCVFEKHNAKKQNNDDGLVKAGIITVNFGSNKKTFYLKKNFYNC